MRTGLTPGHVPPLPCVPTDRTIRSTSRRRLTASNNDQLRRKEDLRHQERPRHQGDAADRRAHQRARAGGCRRSPTPSCAAKTAEFRRRLDKGAHARRPAARGLRGLPRGGPARARRCATSTCSSSAAWSCTSGSIAEMKTGEGKTLVATLPVLPERARAARASTSSPSTTTSPAATPSGWAASTTSSACRVGVVVHGLTDARTPAQLPLRHHLRHEQRVRLRLPARQHEVLDRATTCSAS